MRLKGLKRPTHCIAYTKLERTKADITADVENMFQCLPSSYAVIMAYTNTEEKYSNIPLRNTLKGTIKL